MKSNLEEEIKIIIPSGPGRENIKRAKTAIDFSKNNINFQKKGVISGLGPDTNMALGYEKNPGKEKLNFHKELYDYVMENTDWMVGIDTQSLNSIENILNVFPKGIKGKFAIVSYPLHLMRFKKIINDAQKSDKISKDIEVTFVPTKQNPKYIIYETLSNIKYHVYGKKKYFGKD